MKLICTNEAYIQFKDLLLIINSADSYPVIFLELLNDDKFIKEQKLEDFIKFDNFNIIEYLKTLDWLVDYYQYENQDMDELINEINENVLKLNRTVNIYMSLDDNEISKNRYFKKQYQMLENKITDLKEILLYKNNNSTLKIPSSENTNFRYLN